MGLTRPEQMFGNLEKGDLIQSGEVVNGVKTDHYRVKDFQLALSAAASRQGEIWIAQDGGYTVKFSGEAQGQVGLGKTQAQGTMTWEYDLTEINRLAGISLPAECASAQQANEDIPVPSNASEKDIYGGVIAFSSPDAPGTVADYYRIELPANGWTISDESTDDPLYIFKIKKDDRKMQVMISPGENEGSAVIITQDE
jgi:hypothetical protein